MNKFIVTTTIHPVSKAMRLFCQKKDWQVIIVGDLKTPHEEYEKLEKKYKNVLYLSPKKQEKRYKKLSDSIGWKSIQRRNVGFVYAYQEGADIIASVDDDNIPYDNWGKNLFINKTIEVDCFNSKNKVFDPLSVTKSNYLWHRGYPIQLLDSRKSVTRVGKVKRKVLMQADLWEGDPDIDAIARLTFKPMVTYKEIKRPYCSNQISPFNSQNTFFSRDVIPYYAVLPFVGRMDDIWGGYILQHHFPKSLIYNVASVYQDRNKQDLITNLEKEIIGYRNSLDFINNLSNYEKYLPEETKYFFDIYRNSF